MKPLIDHRNNLIRSDFNEMHEEQKLRIDHVLDELSKKYFLNRHTIRCIVKDYPFYKNAREAANAPQEEEVNPTSAVPKEPDVPEHNSVTTT